MFVKIPSIKENVSVVESFIENVGEKIRIEEAIYGNVLVSVTEAVNNAIVHGNKEDKNKKGRLKDIVEGADDVMNERMYGQGFGQDVDATGAYDLANRFTYNSGAQLARKAVDAVSGAF